MERINQNNVLAKKLLEVCKTKKQYEDIINIMQKRDKSHMQLFQDTLNEQSEKIIKVMTSEDCYKNWKKCTMKKLKYR